jgi:6-phosphogluconolactonase
MNVLRNYSDLSMMSSDAAQMVEIYISEALEKRDSFSLVLSGGALIQSLYRALFYRDNIPWKKIHFFVTDEKCLPNDNRESNFQNAVNSLLRRSNIPLQNIHWINPEIIPLKKAASEYQKTIKHYLSKNDNFFDLILLSIGPDGHIASLFPGFPALMEKKKMVVLTEKSLLDPRVKRITMTLPALNRSRKVLYFINEADCNSILNEMIFRNKDDRFSYPAEQIQPIDGELTWFILQTGL